MCWKFVGAILLSLAAFFAYAARFPIRCPLSERDRVLHRLRTRWLRRLVSLPKLQIRWPQLPNFCVGLCTRRGVHAMNYRLLLQSAVFVLEGLLLVLLLSAAPPLRSRTTSARDCRRSVLPGC